MVEFLLDHAAGAAIAFAIGAAGAWTYWRLS